MLIEIVLGMVVIALVRKKLKNVSKATPNAFVQRLTRCLLLVFYGLARVVGANGICGQNSLLASGVNPFISNFVDIHR